MAEVPVLWSTKRNKLQLFMHPAQLALWDNPARFNFFVAGTQSGKTSFGPFWLWREIQRMGGGDYLAVTSTYDLFKLKMLPEMKRVMCDTLGIARYWPGDHLMELKDPKTGKFAANKSSDPMWGRVILRSANAEGGLESATAKAAWLDECGQDAFSIMAWEAVLRRLSLSQGRVLGTTTPYNLGWLADLYHRWENKEPGSEDYHFVTADSTVNPLFPTAEFERARRDLPEWKFQMFYRGRFTRPAGLIYEDFWNSEATLWVEPFPIPSDWPWYVGIDFGAVHTAFVWIAHDVERDAFYLVDETLEGMVTSREHGERAMEKAKRRRVVDWRGGAKSEQQQRWDFNAAGVPVIAPDVPDVEAQIDRIVGFFRRKQLFIFNTCKGVRDELGSYGRVVDDATGLPTEKIKDDSLYHRLAALRYVGTGLPVAGTGLSAKSYEDYVREQDAPPPSGLTVQVVRPTGERYVGFDGRL